MKTGISDALIEAAMLLAVGMSVVFLFLSLLIIVINLIAKWAEKYPDSNLSQQADKKISQRPATVSPAVVSAITAAISQYKKNH